jgi:hypothetical protein
VGWRGGREGVVNSGRCRGSLGVRLRWRKCVWICILSRFVDVVVVVEVVVVMILLSILISYFFSQLRVYNSRIIEAAALLPLLLAVILSAQSNPILSCVVRLLQQLV